MRPPFPRHGCSAVDQQTLLSRLSFKPRWSCLWKIAGFQVLETCMSFTCSWRRSLPTSWNSPLMSTTVGYPRSHLETRTRGRDQILPWQRRVPATPTSAHRLCSDRRRVHPDGARHVSTGMGSAFVFCALEQRCTCVALLGTCTVDGMARWIVSRQTHIVRPKRTWAQLGLAASPLRLKEVLGVEEGNSQRCLLCARCCNCMQLAIALQVQTWPPGS